MFNGSLTIAIPLYNESKTIEYLKERLSEAIEKIDVLTLKILLIEDGSTDNTYELLKDNFLDFKNSKIIQHDKNKNLNGFLSTVIKNCDTDLVVFLDSDCTFDPIYISEMLNFLSPDVDIVNGSPYHPEGDIEGVKKGRLLISNTANAFYKLLVDKNIYTYTSIFKMYRTSKIRNIILETKGFVAVTELFVKCILNGANVKEFPCILKIRKFGDSKIHILNSTKNHLLFMNKLIFKNTL